MRMVASTTGTSMPTMNNALIIGLVSIVVVIFFFILYPQPIIFFVPDTRLSTSVESKCIRRGQIRRCPRFPPFRMLVAVFRNGDDRDRRQWHEWRK